MTRQRAQGRERGGVAVPEAPARAAHVPVREVVDERRDRVAGAGGVVVVETLGDGLDRRGQPRQRPAVEIVRRRGIARLDAVDVRVQDVEAVRVPELEQELAQRLADGLDAEQVAVPRQLVRQEVPAERVRAVAVDHVPRHDDVAERLRHLLALGVGDVAEAEDGPVRALVEQQRGDRDQAVEPAAGLVDRLADVVGGELLLELRPGSRTARATGRTASNRSRTRRRSPRARGAAARRRSATGSRRRPRTAGAGRRARRRDSSFSSSNEPMQTVSPGVVAPDRQRRAPVALAAQRPVDVVLQPAPEAAGLDVLRVPVDAVVGRQQPVLDLRGARCTRTAWRSRAAACRSASSAGSCGTAARSDAAGRGCGGPRSGPRRRP